MSKGTRSQVSDTSMNLQVMLDGNTPRKTRTSRKVNAALQNTPDRNEAEIERPSPRAVRSRRSRRLDDKLSDETENNISLLNASTIVNNSQLDPEHLYGLDNPDNDSSGKEKQTEQDARPDLNVQHKTRKEQCFWICITFLVCIVAVVFIGWSISLNSNLAHEKPDTISPEKFPNEELAVKLKEMTERLNRLEKGNKLYSAQSYSRLFIDDKAVKANGEELDRLITSRIEQALQIWDADKIGIPDYALESAGGQIHSAYHSATFSNGAPQLLVFGIPLWYEVKTPRVVIQLGNTPGDCWAFQGKEGFVVIKLSQMIKPSSFTLEHMAASLSQFGDRSIPSAPKDFSVWGWSDAHGKEKTKLGEYVYDHEGTALQNFPVQASTVSNFRFIELRVHSNHGNPSYTCLYRFRVHGSPYKNNSSN